MCRRGLGKDDGNKAAEKLIGPVLAAVGIALTAYASGLAHRDPAGSFRPLGGLSRAESCAPGPPRRRPGHRRT